MLGVLVGRASSSLKQSWYEEAGWSGGSAKAGDFLWDCHSLALTLLLLFPSILSQMLARPSEQVQWAWWKPGQLEIVSHLMRAAVP